MLQPVDPVPRTLQNRKIVKRVMHQHIFDGRRRGTVEMHPAPAVDHQPDGRLTPVAAGADGAQKRVLHPHDRGVGPLRHRLAARRGGAAAPDADTILRRTGLAKADVIARKVENAFQARLGQEAAVIDVKRVLRRALSLRTAVIAPRRVGSHQFPAAFEMALAELAVPVRTESVFCH